MPQREILLLFAIPLLSLASLVASLSMFFSLAKKPKGKNFIIATLCSSILSPIVYLVYLFLTARSHYTGDCPFIGDPGSEPCGLTEYFLKYYLVGWAGLNLVGNAIIIILLFFISLTVWLFIYGSIQKLLIRRQII